MVWEGPGKLLSLGPGQCWGIAGFIGGDCGGRVAGTRSMELLSDRKPALACPWPLVEFGWVLRDY